MKIGCFALVEPFTDLRRQVELIAEMGFQYADLTDTHDGADLLAEFEHSAAASLDAHPADIRKAFEGTGVTLTAICAHSNLLDPMGPSTYGTNQIIKAIKLAHFLGIDQVVTTEGEPRTDFGKSLTREQQLFAIQERLYHPIRWAKELNISILIEPHGPVSDSLEAMKELFERLGEPETVGINLDTGNLWLGGGDSLEFIEHFGKRIKHVHWKDYSAEWKSKRGKVFGSGKGNIPLGDGVAGIKEVVMALKKIGFDGPTTLEVGGIENLRKSAERLREWNA
jgi:inosose dehydratase